MKSRVPKRTHNNPPVTIWPCLEWFLFSVLQEEWPDFCQNPMKILRSKEAPKDTPAVALGVKVQTDIMFNQIQYACCLCKPMFLVHVRRGAKVSKWPGSTLHPSRQIWSGGGGGGGGGGGVGALLTWLSVLLVLVLCRRKVPATMVTNPQIGRASCRERV